MATARTIRESMFVLVSPRADSKCYPVALQGCLPLFTTAEAAATFLREVEGIPGGAKVSRECGWGRVIGIMRLAREDGATLVAVDPTATAKGVSLDESLKALENMLEQVALTATALLRRCLSFCTSSMGMPKPDMTLPEGVEVLDRVVRALAPQGEIAEAATSIDVSLRSLSASAVGVEPAPRVPFIPEGAIGMFVPWVEARMDWLSRGRGGSSGAASNN